MSERLDKYYTTLEKAKKYQDLQPLLKAMYKEFSELSKKKPEGAVSKTKISMVNRLLKDLHKLLEEGPNVQFLDFLNEDAIPQYSDVVLILSQYTAAMEAFEAMHYGWIEKADTNDWLTEKYKETTEDEYELDDDEDSEEVEDKEP